MILSVKLASLSRDISEGAKSIPWVMKEDLLTKATIAPKQFFFLGCRSGKWAEMPQKLWCFYNFLAPHNSEVAERRKPQDQYAC